MSKNIKEIGKELLGKSLNSFHRKTGLIQLEKNNEMQDGILDGILSQVDDAYIEKTEQSNVIHLDGSGDGVVVLDSLEGNTMVNIVSSYDDSRFRYLNATKLEDNWFKLQHSSNENSSNVRVIKGTHIYKPNTTYTIIVDIKENTANARLGLSSINSCIDSYVTNFPNLLGVSKTKFTTRTNLEDDGRGGTTTQDLYFCSWDKGGDLSNHITFRYWILEGDWTNRDLPPYFQGLQSSFEEKVNDEGKYEIEILMKNKNLLDLKNPVKVGGYAPAKMEGDKIVLNSSGVEGERVSLAFPVYMKKGSTYRFSYSNIEGNSEVLGATLQMHPDLSANNQFGVSTKNPFTWDRDSGIYYARVYNMYVAGTVKANIQLEENNIATTYIEPKQNKIKLLINEPLRAVGDVKDKLCIKDNKLVVERNIYSQEISPNIGYIPFIKNNHLVFAITPRLTPKGVYGMCNMFATDNNGWQYIQSEESDNREFCQFYSNFNYIHIKKSRLSSSDTQGVNEWLLGNKVVLVYPLEEPYYEEVTNEYGEPILLEGYDNGTLYIDSTVIPTTTVKYTPKMESLNTLKEVYNNNVMLTSDVNDNIIPYMMEVDLMIMEKEMALPSQINIRKMEVLDMTSMQKRTQDMLERLIKGKTLTEQECKTRVTTYLNAGKITDEQAEELMLLIDEVYA